MLKLMKFKLFFFIFSVIIILPGLYYLATSGLKLGIDFTGGSLLEYKFQNDLKKEDLEKYGIITPAGEKTYIIRTKPQDPEHLTSLKEDIKKDFGDFEARREESVGPIIGNELKQKAFIAILMSCVAIVIYITYAFRKVPRPASSLRFGVAAIAALVHDVLVIVGLFAILGKYFDVEVDVLFVTALLTIIGFSVHDTIVVFDRIRENLLKHVGKKFSDVADISITQTIARSLNTSLTVLFVLLALVLFGGESIHWFVVALLIGIISGTYSSIFNATALLAYWEEKLGH